MSNEQTNEKVRGYLERAQKLVFEPLRSETLHFDTQGLIEMNKLVIEIAKMLQKEEHES